MTLIDRYRNAVRRIDDVESLFWVIYTMIEDGSGSVTVHEDGADVEMYLNLRSEDENEDVEWDGDWEGVVPSEVYNERFYPGELAIAAPTAEVVETEEYQEEMRRLARNWNNSISELRFTVADDAEVRLAEDGTTVQVRIIGWIDREYTE